MRRPHFLGAVLHSAFARDRYLALGLDASRLLVAHNGYDPSLLSGLPEKSELRAELGLPRDSPLVVYAGHVNLTKGSARLPVKGADEDDVKETEDRSFFCMVTFCYIWFNLLFFTSDAWYTVPTPRTVTFVIVRC